MAGFRGRAQQNMQVGKYRMMWGTAEEGVEVTVLKLGDPTSAFLEVHSSWCGPRLLAPTLPHTSSPPAPHPVRM